MDAILAVRELGPVIAPLLQISEIRTVAADDLWLSSAYGADVVGLHFTWLRDQVAVEAALPALEAALLPLGARPHRGKLYLDPAPRRSLTDRASSRDSFTSKLGHRLAQWNAAAPLTATTVPDAKPPASEAR